MPTLPFVVRRSLGLLLAACASAIVLPAAAATGDAAGLLFYLSGEKGTTADIAAQGTAEPTFVKEITQIPDGARGVGLSCSHEQLLAYRAPGNIYAQRGTLSFYWRAREEVGPTEFAIFRVAYAEHSSWDMVWLRIDYNGHGFDAFVTDVNLARTRVSVTLDPFPKPSEWTHLALSWDENRGIRFYVNGKLAAEQAFFGRYDAALDQFGPHSRIISPYQVQSDYNFLRGGDIDEVRIHNHALTDAEIAQLRSGGATTAAEPARRDLSDANTRREWNYRYGWGKLDQPPPHIAGRNVSARKVEINDAYDLKRWWWKANDGLRETTWPAPYNRSRIPGRNDYFQLPDWDCYVESGQAITFTAPEETWNYVTIDGSPAGTVTVLKERMDDTAAGQPLFTTAEREERIVRLLGTHTTGKHLRFTNLRPEEPIGEFSLYQVGSAKEPAGQPTLEYRLDQPQAAVDSSVSPLQAHIKGRYPADEQAALIAVPASKTSAAPALPSGTLPLIHILIPNDSGTGFRLDKVDGGLDGLAIDFPALRGPATHGEVIPVNIQIKDPLWPLRSMANVSFSVKPDEPQTFWIDLRDRILPEGKALYLTLASASPQFDAASLTSVRMRLVFKSKEAARAEHEIDRFTQARDSYAMLVEEHPRGPKFDLWNRFEADIKDLIRVNPNHIPGRNYYDFVVEGKVPELKHPAPAEGVPLWAARQVQLLKHVAYFVNWWIDHRQVPYGDFGGGISDDVDLTNTWPGVALMGVTPEKIKASTAALLDAAYKNGMFTNGLPTIQSDFLHSYEEGINCIGQNLILDHGNPKQLERAMETARGVESITGINSAGHRHIRSSYFSGTKVAEDSVWGVSRGYSYLILQPTQLLGDYNGNPDARKVVIELAEGLLAHRFKNAKGEYQLPGAIHFKTDKNQEVVRTYFPWPIFWSAWSWTQDPKFLLPLKDNGGWPLLNVNANALDLLNLRKEWGARLAQQQQQRRPAAGPGPVDFRGLAAKHIAWQITGDKKQLEELYTREIEVCQVLEYINTEGSLWSDRVNVPFIELQRARLGGVALVRNGTVPGHAVSWDFRAPATAESVAILVPFATPTRLTVVAYNLEAHPVRATMTGWAVDPGLWELTQGVDSNDDDKADAGLSSRTLPFERSRGVDIDLPPRASTVLTMELKQPSTPYWHRPDLGLTSDDVSVKDGHVVATVHSLGSVASPETVLALRDASGRIVSTASIPPIAPPLDLRPKTTEVRLPLPAGIAADKLTVEIDPDGTTEEITRMNNRAELR